MLISHRGNLEGPRVEFENSPEYIQIALDAGYSVEIDLRVIEKVNAEPELWLGHDEMQYQIDCDWLKKRALYLWIHCKNREALEFCLNNKLHCFWHDKDDYTMTNCGYIWAFPGKLKAGPFTVMVLPERHNSIEEVRELDCFGVCSDYIDQIKHK